MARGKPPTPPTRGEASTRVCPARPHAHGGLPGPSSTRGPSKGPDTRAPGWGCSRPGTRAGGRVVCGGGGPREHGEGAVSEADGRCLTSDPPWGAGRTPGRCARPVARGPPWPKPRRQSPLGSCGRLRGASPQVCSGCWQDPVPFKAEAPGSWWPPARGHPGLLRPLSGPCPSRGIASQ